MTAGICLKRCRENLCGGENARAYDSQEAELYQQAVQKQENEVVGPTPTKNLLRMQRK